jgi:hypothetical protein
MKFGAVHLVVKMLSHLTVEICNLIIPGELRPPGKTIACYASLTRCGIGVFNCILQIHFLEYEIRYQPDDCHDA